MNCKPGDLAVIVHGCLAGAIVRVTELDPLPSPCGRPLWFYDGDVRDAEGERYESIWDHVLRPIRDQPGADETLTWAGRPSDIETPEAA